MRKLMTTVVRLKINDEVEIKFVYTFSGVCGSFSVLHFDTCVIIFRSIIITNISLSMFYLVHLVGILYRQGIK